MILLCQICGEFIGQIELNGQDGSDGRPKIEALKSPLRGSMIGSADPFHGLEPPFDPAATWEFMFCPFSRKTHWPFSNTGKEPEQLLTHKGMIDIPSDDVEMVFDVIDDEQPEAPEAEVTEFICAKCGKSFETARKMNSHQSAHKGGKNNG